MSNKVLVFGGSGQLACCIKSIVDNDKTQNQYIFLNSSDGDVTNLLALQEIFNTEKPNYVINCAAYTAVDLAEDEPEIAKVINEIGAKNLALCCKASNSILLQISTDFIFEGNLARPLLEEDEAKPISVYGKTKLDGEKAIQKNWEKHFIIRTSWLYSEFNNNFCKTMIKLAQSRTELGIISDQVGSPTYAVDLAELLVFLIHNKATEYGTYHFSNEGVASWYDFAHEIFELYGLKIKVNAIRTVDYPTKAKRPAYSIMSKHKVKTTFNYPVHHWRDQLKICITNLKQQQ